MLPFCLDGGIGVIPWSPLARGRLARPWTASTHRSETDGFGKMLYAATEENDREIVETLCALADEHGLPPARIALAWLLAKPMITAPIVGATRENHLPDAVAALEVTLSTEEIARLEAPYRPHPVVGVDVRVPTEFQGSLLKSE